MHGKEIKLQGILNITDYAFVFFFFACSSLKADGQILLFKHSPHFGFLGVQID